MLLYLSLALPMTSHPCEDMAPHVIRELSKGLVEPPLKNCAELKSRGFCEVRHTQFAAHNSAQFCAPHFSDDAAHYAPS